MYFSTNAEYAAIYRGDGKKINLKEENQQKKKDATGGGLGGGAGGLGGGLGGVSGGGIGVGNVEETEEETEGKKEVEPFVFVLGYAIPGIFSR
jgi:hypothetical protein